MQGFSRRLLDMLRIDTEGASTLLLQLLAWKRVSQTSLVPELLSIQDVLASSDPIDAAEKQLVLLGESEALGASMDAFTGEDVPLEYLPTEVALTLLAAIDNVNPRNVPAAEYLALLHKSREGLYSRVSPRDYDHPTDPEQATRIRRASLETSVPPWQASLIVDLAGIRAGESVYVPFDGSMMVAVEAALRGGNVHVECYTSETYALLQLANILLACKMKIVLCDSVASPTFLDEDGGLTAFDVVLAIPPSGIRYRGDLHPDPRHRFPEATNLGDVLHVRQVLAQMAGTGVVLIPDALLARPAGAERDLRRDLLDKAQVHGVISLADGSKGLPTSLLLLGQPRPGGIPLIKEGMRGAHERGSGYESAVQARNKATRAALADPGTRLLDAATVAQNDYILAADHYLKAESTPDPMQALAGTETTVLGDLVETIRPQYLTAAGNEAEATFAEVSVTDFGDDGYVQTPRKVVRVDRDMIGRAERQRLAPLDVVLVIKGSVGRVGLVPSDLSEAWIANQSCLILRLHKYGPLRSPIVLARYLLSPLGQALLGKIATSATVPTLQIRDLKALPVIIPDQAEQSAILDTDQELFALGREITQAQERLALLHGRHWPL